jgi:hypothetical protein
MTRVLVFAAVLLGTCLYAFRRGGAPERCVASLLLAAAIASYLLPHVRGYTYFHVEWQRVAVDTLLLGGLVAVSLAADRFWPLYLTAFHALTVMTHGVRAYDPAVLPIVYTRVAAWLAYPGLLLLVIGVARHQRRLRAGTHEFDWTFQRRRMADEARTCDARRTGMRGP